MPLMTVPVNQGTVTLLSKNDVQPSQTSKDDVQPSQTNTAQASQLPLLCPSSSLWQLNVSDSQPTSLSERDIQEIIS